MNLEECYRVLELKPGASLRESRTAYYKLLKFFHPDRHQASPGLLRKATEETKKLNLAYEQLCKVLKGSRSSNSTSSEDRRRPSRSPQEGSVGAPVPGQPFTVPSCGIQLNWIAPGQFVMGSPPAEAGRSNDEGPQTNVTITRGFWLGIVPVTQEEWKEIAENVSGLNPEPSFFRGDRLPVEQVSWHDCQAWLRELNVLEEHRLPQNHQYRLPTEAEWEFACRAGTFTRFHSGEAEVGIAPLTDYAWYTLNSAGKSHKVGEKKPNNYGLHDMHGNVWEWCNDFYGLLPGGTVTDPTGPAAGFNRVLRGGSWGVPAARCRSAYRVWNQPTYRDYTLGFRIALASG